MKYAEWKGCNSLIILSIQILIYQCQGHLPVLKCFNLDFENSANDAL